MPSGSRILAGLQPMMAGPAPCVGSLASGMRRWLAIHSAAPPNFYVFNSRAKYLQKERAAENVKSSRETDYLKDEVARRLCERLLDIKRDFPRVLDFGANSCNLARILIRENPDPLMEMSPPIARRIGHLVAVESSPGLLYRDGSEDKMGDLTIERKVISDDAPLPFEAESFDMVLSSLSMHWINDLPGALGQINAVLKKDCPFIGAMLGGDTLFELRTSLQLAEQERKGGISPHVSPLADVRDVGNLLQRTGFKMLTVDVEDIIVDYPDMFALMGDLKAMGEGNAVKSREMGPIGRDILISGDAIYKALHGNEDGSIPATFRIIYMIGWKEGGNQPKPAKRGSGHISLIDALKNKE